MELEAELKRYIATLKCLEKHLGQNAYAPFRNCDLDCMKGGDTHQQSLCGKLVAVLREEFNKAELIDVLIKTKDKLVFANYVDHDFDNRLSQLLRKIQETR